MIPRTTMRRALEDPNLLGTALPGPSWRPWRVLLIAAMGEELTPDERVIFKQLTGREREPGQRVEELVGVIGRRGGKSLSTATLSAYIAGCCRHERLVRGEVGVCLIVAPDQRQATIILDYATAIVEASPILRQLIESRTAESIRLNNGIEITVRAASSKRLRGPTYVMVTGDETAFFPNDEAAADPDTEIFNAVRPGLATTDGLLVMISSPYARRGELWAAYDKHFGANGDPLILVAKATSREMNSTLPERVVARAYERDPVAAAAEYGAEFRSDLEDFVSREVVANCLSQGERERPPQPGIAYLGFTDPSGGANDSFTLAISHIDYNRQTAVIDVVREIRAPFSPEWATSEHAAVLRKYGITSVVGDRYGGEWPREQFGKFGIHYAPSDKSKSDLYNDLLASLNSHRVDLLDNPRLIGQLLSLERRTSRGGRPSIDHRPGAMDDVANAVAGAASLAITRGVYNLSALADTLDTKDDRTEAEAYRMSRYSFYLLSGGMRPPF